MITMSNLGNNGRLANQLFQYSAMIGLSKKYKSDLVLPDWKYSKYFEGIFPSGKLNNATPVKEPEFHYTPEYFEQFLNYNKSNYDISGYFQSQKYWSGAVNEIKKAVTFKSDFIKLVYNKYSALFQKETIAIHIRRGDYVGNDYYYQLPITYYILALFQIEDWENKNILVFSDEPKYAKFHFGCLPNVTIIEGNADIFDLCLASFCDNFILSNSSYSWWMAKLSEKSDHRAIRKYKKTTVIYPANYFTSPKNMEDYWPSNWKPFNHENKKIDLTDTTFMIPVQYDFKDRLENMNLTVRFIFKDFDTNLIINENLTAKFSHLGGIYLKSNHIHFHRTRMLNAMALRAETPIIVNWDADVFAAPLQIYQAVKAIRKGADLSYPYLGRFAKMPRLGNYQQLNRANDLGVFSGIRFKGMLETDIISVGGAVFFNRESYFKAGGENENFVSWGPEDAERLIRFEKLGFKAVRIPGVLYHLDHQRGNNSSARNQFIHKNRAEYEKVAGMSAEDLKEYVKTWKK